MVNEFLAGTVEGWWTANHLLGQVIDYVIPIFKALHHNAIDVFAFDNNINHGAMPPDGLNMNVKPGGKQAIMRDIYFGSNKTFQSMVHMTDNPAHWGGWRWKIPDNSKDTTISKISR
nr:12601_t:CDS:2 [Entrophospora candida]